jgi:hypothetical protein
MEPNQKYLMSGSLYRAELGKETDGLWKFTKLCIRSTWTEGDYSLMGGEFSKDRV